MRPEGYVPEPQAPTGGKWATISKMPPGWNNSNFEWTLPDWQYSRERFEEQWKKYEMIKEFEEKNKFEEQTMCFYSDYPQLLEKPSEKKAENDKKPKEEEEVIKLTRPIDFDDLNYFMDNYKYDPKDDVVNNYNDTQAENFIRRKVIEYRKSIGKQI